MHNGKTIEKWIPYVKRVFMTGGEPTIIKRNLDYIDKIIESKYGKEVELIFISHDGKTAEILGNAFAEDLGFTNVYVLDGGIQSWINSNKPLEKYN